jgi:hypothetical protein
MQCCYDYGLVNICAGLAMFGIMGTVAIIIYLLDKFAFSHSP